MATTSDDLAERIDAAILSATIPGDPLSVLARVAEAEEVVRDLLRQTVGSARAAGHSWAAIGAELKMSRQAAQQRFGAPPASEQSTGDRERWLGPVTAFDEIRGLNWPAGGLAHRGGRDAAHRMVRTDTRWAHKRVVWPGSLARSQRNGWQIGCRPFPWVYLIRDMGRPAEPEATT